MSADDLRSGTWVTYARGRPSGLSVRRCRLSVVEGPDAGLSREFASSTIGVGTLPGADLVLSDKRVSRPHLELCLEERGYRLRDRESKNGTYVAGRRVIEVYIDPGDIIELGATRIHFEALADSVELAVSAGERLCGLVGRSLVMRALFARIEALA